MGLWGFRSDVCKLKIRYVTLMINFSVFLAGAWSIGSSLESKDGRDGK